MSEAEIEQMNKECYATPAADVVYWKSHNFDAKSMKVSCSSSSIKSAVYDEENCKGDIKELLMEWGECKKFTMGETTTYIKITGSMALQAASTLALAILAS